MKLTISQHAIERYRQRFDRDGTVGDMIERFNRSEIPPAWVSVVFDDRGTGRFTMVDDDCVFLVDMGEASVDIATVLPMAFLRKNRAGNAIHRISHAS